MEESRSPRRSADFAFTLHAAIGYPFSKQSQLTQSLKT